MLSLSLHENKPCGDADFPAEYYYVDGTHPRYQMPFHWHQEWELIRVLQGSVVFHINNKEITAQTGDVLLLAEGLLHGGTPEDLHCIYECMVFSLPGMFSGTGSQSKYLAPLLRLDNIPLPYYSCREYPELAELIVEIMQACKNAKADALSDRYIQNQRLITIGCLTQLLGHVLLDELFDTDIRQDYSYHVAQIKSVLTYIEQNYGSPITLDALAGVAGVSPKYFCEVFRQITHKTPMDYVLFYRIEQACILLSSTDLPITEISLRCGFNDSGYFARRFKYQVHLSPTQYRKQTI